MLQTTRGDAVGAELLLLPMLVAIAHHDPLGAGDIGILTGKAEATFLGGDQLIRNPGQNGVDQAQRLIFLFGGVHHHDTQRDTDLRSSETDAGRLVHGLEHVIHQTAQAIVRFAHRRRRPFERRMRSDENVELGHRLFGILRRSNSSKAAACRKSRLQSALVEIIEFTAHGKSMGETRGLAGEWCQTLGQVMRSRLAFHRRTEGQNDLLYTTRFDSRQQSRDSQAVGRASVQRRQGSTQDVIEATITAAAIHGPEILDLLNDEYVAGVPPLIGADRTGIAAVEISAHTASADRQAALLERLLQRSHEGVGVTHEAQDRPSRRTRSQPRKPAHQLDEALDLRGCQ